MAKKRIAVLGATGSIGKSSLDIISRDNENFEVVLLCARSKKRELEKLSEQFPKAACVLAEDECGGEKFLCSEVSRAITETRPDITINGISGASGLLPSIAAIEAGSDLALANKETIVMAGNLVMRKAIEKNVNIIPVDSEHSAVFHLMRNYGNSCGLTEKNPASSLPVTAQLKQCAKVPADNLIYEIILTASGGPFRNYSIEEMKNVTVKDALSHPTWNMGTKITIDSASMANKGLEIIEACVFFDIPPEKIKVVIHPQSIVHSMIRLCNGVIYAQLSKPDMRHPIHDALYWPATTPLNIDFLNFDSLNLEFNKPDLQKFPMLRIAWTAAKKGGLYTCAYNAANETAVSAFVEQKIKFTDIPLLTEQVLQSDWTGDDLNLEAILHADREARLKALSVLNCR